MAQREFVNWTAEQTPYGTASWAMIDGLLHVRSTVGTKVAHLRLALAAKPSVATDVAT